MSGERGFTLIELMIVVTIIAIISAVAVPNLLSSKMAANESNAISTLRNLVSAQATFQSQGAVDNDADGAGEFGTFGELSGLTLLNARGAGPAKLLDPPIMGNTFKAVDAQGRVQKSGYYFRIYLPDALGAGLPELAAGGPPPGLGDDFCETFWCAYAWPMDPGTTGGRAFFVDHRGEIIQTRMDVLAYDDVTAPAWGAALTAVAGDMSDALALTGASNDGNEWNPLP